MPTTTSAMNAFINALRVNCSDYNRKDIDNNSIGARASKSYWIAEGWISDRWESYGLPQIGVFSIGGGVISEGDLGERYEQQRILVDIFTSGINQRKDLTEQVKNALLLKDRRNSLNDSGVKIDRLLSDIDIVADDIIPQDVYRRQLVFGIIYKASGT